MFNTRKAIRALLLGTMVVGTSLTASTALALAGNPIQIDDSEIMIIPPDGFEQATDFSGLMNVRTNGSVIVAEFPAEASEQVGALFKDFDTAREQFAAKGVEVRSLDAATVGDEDGSLVRGTQEAAGVVYNKWIAFVGGDEPLMVTVQSPEDGELKDEDVLNMLKSISRS